MSSSVLFFVIPSRLRYVACSLDGTLSDVTSGRHSTLDILLDQIHNTDHTQTTSPSAFVSLLSTMSSMSTLIFSCLATFGHSAANVSIQNTSSAIDQHLNSLFAPLPQHEIDLQQAQRELRRTLLLKERSEALERLRAQKESRTRMKDNWRHFLNRRRHDKVCLLYLFRTLSEVLIDVLCIERTHRLGAAASSTFRLAISVVSRGRCEPSKSRLIIITLEHHR